MTPAEQWTLLELWERARDGRLTEAEQATLNDAITHNPEARRLLAEAAFMDAELRLTGESGAGTGAAPGSATSHAAPIARATFGWRHALTAAAAALIATGAVLLIEREPAPAATLVKARACKWGNSALPTLEGARLKPGALELLEGMATLQFESGAQVVLEAPVSLEVVSAMECRVRKGTVVADVPPQAKGFTIHTPATKVVDYGTRFGVSAGEDGKCLVHVIEGLVEVERAGEPGKKELRAGQRVDYGDFVAHAVNPDAAPRPAGDPASAGSDDQPEPGRWLPGPLSDLGDGWQVVTPAFGQGRDTWIQSSAKHITTGRESYLRVKHTSHDEKLDRKAYIAFDISRFAGRPVEEAEFVLHVEPSDLGFAALVPDAVFAVYALTDETQDAWKESALSWAAAPAHDQEPAHRITAIAGQSRLLGQFTVPQGTTRGAFSIKGPALAEFLRSDTNGLVTFIVIRQTDETARNGLAHAFASKENTRNAPPMLRIKTGDGAE